MIRSTVFLGIVKRQILWGIALGIALGAIAPVILPIIVAIVLSLTSENSTVSIATIVNSLVSNIAAFPLLGSFGGAHGLITGLAVGLMNGLAVGWITTRFYFLPQSSHAYRIAVGLVTAFVSAVTGLFILNLLLNYWNLRYLLLPSLLIVIASAVFAGQQTASWYLRMIFKAASTNPSQ